MYDNGEKLNQYARKRLHIDKLKKRHTPRGYKSYKQYVDIKRNEELAYELCHGYPKYTWYRRRGKPEYFEQYWHGYTGFLNPKWKKDLKQAAHKEERNYWRNRLNDYYCYEEDEYDVPIMRKGYKSGDPWDWD